MTWNVLLPKEIHSNGSESIRDIATFTPISEFGTSPADFTPYIHNFDVIILRIAHLSDDVLNIADDLKIIAKHGIVLDNVDIGSATENGVSCAIRPGQMLVPSRNTRSPLYSLPTASCSRSMARHAAVTASEANGLQTNSKRKRSAYSDAET